MMDIKQIMSSEKLLKITHMDKIYYYHPEVKILSLMDMHFKGEIESYCCGLEGMMPGFYFFQTNLKSYEKATPAGRGSNYPDDFERFWKAYHPKRRKGKQDSFKAFLGLNASDRILLEQAAKNYTEEINASTSAAYMKLPAGFIRKGLYKDYIETDEHISAVNEFIKYFSETFKSKFNFNYSFNQYEKNLLAADVENIGLEKLKTSCYIFIHNLDQKVVSANVKNHYSYNIFSALLKGVLGKSKKKIEEKCEFCGIRGGHTQSCPSLKDRKAIKKEEREIVEEIMFRDKSIMDTIRENIGRRT